MSDPLAVRLRSEMATVTEQLWAADLIDSLVAENAEIRHSAIEECVRLALEKAIKLELGEITENGSRLNPTAYQWRTIANELRGLQKLSQ